jgi:hypothetical protein
MTENPLDLRSEMAAFGAENNVLGPIAAGRAGLAAEWLMAECDRVSGMAFEAARICGAALAMPVEDIAVHLGISRMRTLPIK